MTDYLPEKIDKTARKKKVLKTVLTENHRDLDDLAEKTGFSRLSLIRILRDGQVPKRFHKLKQIEAQLEYDQKALKRLLQIVDEGTDKDAIAAIRELRTALYPNDTEKGHSGQQTNNYYQTLIQQIADKKGETKKLTFPGYDAEEK